MTSKGIPSATSLPGSEGGPTPSPLLDDPLIVGCGPAPAPASPSPAPGNAVGKRTTAICGPTGGVSLASAALQSCLESRLRAGLDASGSLEYALTWRRWDMELGLPICALRARARRISDSGCSGWPTARQTDGSKSVRTDEGALAEVERKGGPQ